MASAGIDLGNRNCVVAIVRRGGIDICANEVSNRATPCMVSFQGEQRHVGEAAANFAMQNFKNTCTDLLRLLGRRFDDPIVQKEIPRLKYTISARPDDGGVCADVAYGSPDAEGLGASSFSIEALMAMMLGKLAQLGAAESGVDSISCVLSVPGFFDDLQRRALLNAARIANIRVIRLLDEHDAIALGYGIFRIAELPDSEPQKVAIVDIGQSATSVCVGGFTNKEAKVLGVAFDDSLGGRTVDDLLVDHFAREFQEKYKIDPLSRPRPTLRMRADCEKLKKVLSANPEAPLNIECLMDDVDVRGFMKRVDMEEAIRPLAERLESVCRLALANAGVTADQLHSVEVVGGSSRVPYFKRVVESVFGKVPRTTLNADECVARGCAMMSAILSPSFKVRDYGLTSVCPYEVSVLKTFVSGGPEPETIKILPRSHPAPATKALSFVNQGSFSLVTKYSGAGIERDIGDFHVEAPPATEAPGAKVRVKIRMTTDGIVEVSSAQLIQEVEEEEVIQPPPKPAEESKPASDQPNADAPKADAPKADDAEMADAADAASEEKMEEAVPITRMVKKNKVTDLKVVRGTVGLSLTDAGVQNATEMESRMRATDLYLKEKADARNSLESYIYDMRSRLDDYGDLKDFSEDNVRVDFRKKLDAFEDWVYEEEGENASKSVYQSKKKELEEIAAPILYRKIEFDNRDRNVRELRQGCAVYMEIESGGEKYSHLEQSERETVSKKIQEVTSWLEGELAKQTPLAKNVDPVLTGASILSKRSELDSICSPIFNKPKPKPKETPKPPPAAETKAKTAAPEGEAPEADAEMKDAQPTENGETTNEATHEQPPADKAMDVEQQ